MKQKTSRLPRLLAFSALLFGLLGASPAEATTYFTVPAVLKSFFAQSKKVSHRRVTPEAIATIDAKVGAPLVKAEWVVYVGETDGQVDGYAIVDAEKGMHG